MAKIKAVVRTPRADGFYQVYIRVTQGNKVGYIKTDKVVQKKDVKDGLFLDPYVANFCAKRVLEYTQRLNRVDSRYWSVNDIIDYLTRADEDICFSDYARKHINRLIDSDQERTAKNYRWASCLWGLTGLCSLI